MIDAQEFIALTIVALVTGPFIWRRWLKPWLRPADKTSASASGSCGGCASASPPQKEPTVHFYRRRPNEPAE